MPTNTLTSLAILRVQVDLNGDYLTYLEPFVLQILSDCDTNVVTIDFITESLVQRFGLAIPERTVEIVLRRITRRKALTRGNGQFKITGRVPDPQLVSKQAEAERHIQSVINGVRRFSQGTPNPMENEEQVVEALCAFLADFDVSCLRAYLRGSAIPEAEEASTADRALISNYVQFINDNEPERFRSFLILVQGHMLANALVCPDLHNAPQSFSGVTFYLDTPFLIRKIGLEGAARRNAADELLLLLRNLGGKIAVFSHTREELYYSIQGAASNLESPDGRGSIIQEARRAGTSRSDLVLIAETLDEDLSSNGIEVETTPVYTEKIQIDEAAFEEVLSDEVFYLNPRTREFDVNSVRSIYVKRNKKNILSLEKSHAVFVTSNSSFAKAAWQYGQKYDPSQAVSTVITDFTLANTAWLKAPMGAPAVPRTQLMAFSYAALQPSRELLGKYLNEIERLESRGIISERDHQLLRSSPMVTNELMNLTLGDDELITEETVTEILERVTGEIVREESDRAEQIEKERSSTQQALEEQTERSEQLERESLTTKRALEEQIQQNERIRSKLFFDCQRRAKRWARGISVFLAIVLIAIIAASTLEFGGLMPAARWSIVGVVAVLTTANLIYGLTLKGTYQWITQALENRFIKGQAQALGIDLVEYGTD
ncbi:MAG: hypothetical protein F4X66_09005 [Chloroflexi bacterium]|nr:hypothetical protein [Chloroflexota bacterium]